MCSASEEKGWAKANTQQQEQNKGRQEQSKGRGRSPKSTFFILVGSLFVWCFWDFSPSLCFFCSLLVLLALLLLLGVAVKTATPFPRMRYTSTHG